MGPWKIAICGHGGAGKTLFASTAPSPLYVFFSENPRIKSIARRYMPHVKLTNQYKDDVLVTSVQDQLKGLSFWLQIDEHEYQTLVIDTGDELFQAMKEARRAKNAGEFGVGDWGWIADAYREVMEGLIDLHMNVIVLFHIKTAQEGDSGAVYKELMLQGQAKDEAPGWFDVIGALDTYEVVTEDGETLTRRVLLTHSSRMYPWVKDHSGALPHHFQISDDFVGDFGRMFDLLTREDADEKFGSHEVLQVVEPPVEIEIKTGAPVPSPEQLNQKKKEVKEKPKKKPVKAKKPKVETTKEEPEDTDVQDPPQQEEKPVAGIQQPVEEEVVEPEPILSVDPDLEVAAEVGKAEQEEPEEPATSVVRHTTTAQVVEAAEELIKEELGAEQVYLCDVCSEEITDENVRELGQMRFHKYLCRPHYLEALKNR